MDRKVTIHIDGVKEPTILTDFDTNTNLVDFIKSLNSSMKTKKHITISDNNNKFHIIKVDKIVKCVVENIDLTNEYQAGIETGQHDSTREININLPDIDKDIDLSGVFDTGNGIYSIPEGEPVDPKYVKLGEYQYGTVERFEEVEQAHVEEVNNKPKILSISPVLRDTGTVMKVIDEGDTDDND